ncbi:MAG: hypothetical protein WCV71_03640 [Patescibacteria group bacterium]
MNTPEVKVSDVHISIRVGRWLKNQGWELASCGGSKLKAPLSPEDSLGILKWNPTKKPRRGLLRLLLGQHMHLLIGVIWFENSRRSATEDHWVFEFNGEMHRQEVVELCQTLCSVFDTSIEVRLDSDGVRYEDSGDVV